MHILVVDQAVIKIAHLSMISQHDLTTRDCNWQSQISLILISTDELYWAATVWLH